MTSFSKIVHTASHSHNITFSTISSVYKTLGSLLYSTNLPPCGDYDSRKLGHELSGSGVKPDFETVQSLPPGIFRNTQGEILGLGAGKDKCYQNPEYFSYHHMTFYDINLGLKQYRRPSPKTGRKPN